ncbi:uncharacterized protein LOC131948010 [Physella acuta]|uniref:uncharacterized protein LOC131948010 n=1 Tax=Physella acuta TaxID=109671 RepID=UPI0027DCE9F4|nr:uncharacterized protein LOC131948010 [Physella acuta]
MAALVNELGCINLFIRSSMGEATADLDLQSDEFKEFSNSEDVKPLLSTVFSSSSGIKTELSFLTFPDIKPNLTFIASQDDKTVVTPDFSSSTDTKSECTSFSSFDDVKHHMTFLTSQDKTTAFLIFKDMEPAVSAVCTRSEDIKPELENKSTSEDLKRELETLSTSEDIIPELETLSTNKDLKPDLWTKFLDSEDKKQNGLEEKLKLPEDETYLSVDPHNCHEQFFQRSNLNKQAQPTLYPISSQATSFISYNFSSNQLYVLQILIQTALYPITSQSTSFMSDIFSSNQLYVL